MNLLKSLSILGIVASIASCSNAPVVQNFPASASPTEEYGKFETEMKTASEQQVNVLSPKNFEKAEEQLKDARTSISKQKDAEDTLKQIAKGRAYLEQANKFAQVSRTNLEPVVEARRLAIAAGAPKITATEFGKADDQLRDVTSDIEKNKMKSVAKEKSALQMFYMNLELESIKRSNLDKPRSIINQAKKEGAKDFAPRSLVMAEKNVQDFDAYITANRHETAQIAEKNAAALASANHLLKINRAAKSGDKMSDEDMALKMENEQNKVAEKENLVNLTAEQLAAKQAQLRDNQIAAQALLAKNSDLESDKEFNQRFEDARAEFSESEAEVYKQGNTLVIRLKGLEFPASQATLKSSNYPLLGKVQKVLSSFEGKSVIVEGHTDSTGGKKVNEKLSAERAKAVSDYILANSNGETIDIKSLGYDYQKPLASNKTAEGRAKNRRVDILINAENN